MHAHYRQSGSKMLEEMEESTSGLISGINVAPGKQLI